MRWFVEISPLGQNAGPSTTVCVEAPQWKHALQKARALRGDNGALNNFSIELLEDGFRAIDPTTRLRYVVKRAPDDSALTTASDASPPSGPEARALAQTVAFTSTGAAVLKPEPLVKPAAAAAPASVAVPTPEAKKRPLAQTMALPSPGTAALVEPAAEAPAQAAPATPAEAPPAAPATPPSVEAPPSFVLVGSREENPTEGSPLTYREFVFAVAPGTSEEEATRLIMDRFEHVRATFDGARAGKLINLAVFDHVFHGRPQRRPLVTLAWKDWKAEPPEIHYPAREGGPDAPRSGAVAPASTPQPAPVVVAPAAPVVPAPKPISATLSSAQPAVLPKPAPTAEVPVVAASKPAPAKAAEAAPVKAVVVAPVKAVEAAPVKAVVVAPVKAVETAPVKAVVAAPVKAVEAAPVKAVEAAPVKAVEAAPVKAVVVAPVKAVEAAPVKAVEAAPVKAVEAAAMKAIEPLPIKAIEAAPASKPAPKPEVAAPKPVVVPAKVAEPAPKSEPAPETRPVPTVASPVASEAPQPVVPDDAIDIPIEAETATPPPPAPRPADPAPAATPPASAAVAAPPAAPARSAPRPRLSGDDLLTELFEAFGDLHFLRDALEGAEFVLALTMEKLPSEVGLVSLFDMNKREFVVVRQSGGPRSALCARQPERAPLASTAMRKHHAIVVTDPAGARRAMDDRFHAIGVEIKSLVCAPVELGGRYLGLIELANPLDGSAYSEGDGNALTYIGQQFGEFVAARGVIVDPEQIKAEAGAPGPSAQTAQSASRSTGKKPR